jgi:HEAT repeat protein
MFEGRRARLLVRGLLREDTLGSSAKELLKKSNPKTAPYLIEILRAESDNSVEGHKFLSKASGKKVEWYNVTVTAASKIAAKALVPLADKRATDVFRLLLTSEDGELRRTAAKGLNALGEHKWEEYIKGDASDLSRLAASQDPCTWDVLCLGLRHNSRTAASACRDACEAVGTMIIPKLIEELRAGCRRSRIESASALGSIGDRRASDPLMRALGDREEFVAGAAARSLGIMKETRAYEDLSRMLSLEPGRGRALVCDISFALGKLQDYRATEALINIMDCNIQSYALAATRALGDLGGIKALNALVRLLKTPTQELAVKFGPSSTGVALVSLNQAMSPAEKVTASWIAITREADVLRAEAATSLGKLGNPQAAGPLKEAVNDPNPVVQQAVAAALEQLGYADVSGSKGLSEKLGPTRWDFGLEEKSTGDPVHPVMTYFECTRPSGDGTCSDDDCPCGYPGANIPRGTGYFFISTELVEMRRDALSLVAIQQKVLDIQHKLGATMLTAGSGVFMPILMCEQGAKKRGIDLEVAAADAKYWWETGLAPLRSTPLAGKSSRAGV